MNATGLSGDEIERLVDRHIELCELFIGTSPAARREAPVLVTMTDGKTRADCLADLVDRALVAYEGTGFAQDSSIFALKAALVQVITASGVLPPRKATLGA